MYVSPFFIYAGATVVAGIVSRVWVSFRRDHAARKAMTTPLCPPDTLASVFTATDSATDDINILTELNTTLAHLNRQAFAEEFWNVDKDLAKYHKHIPLRSRPTMERALIRLIESDDKWLQIVGGKTCAALKLVQAFDPLSGAVQRNQSDARFKAELESCLDRLRTEPS